MSKTSDLAATDAVTAAYLFRLGDNALVLGHRLSEWCGHAPALEEDMALANVALDLLGQANHWLTLAGELEGAGRSADDLAYFRDGTAFLNALLVEQPNGDFAVTTVRQFLFDAFHHAQLERLVDSSDSRIAAIASRAVKEAAYHLRHSSRWVIRLGDGTDESHERMRVAIDRLWRYCGELFVADETDRVVAGSGAGVDPAELEPVWRDTVAAVFAEATLPMPDDAVPVTGGKQGRHGEHLGHMLAVMQSLARAHPGAAW